MNETIAIKETDRLISSDKVDGTKVYNYKGETLGSVRSFMVDKRSGKAVYAVLQFGGLFGIGSDYYPIPWSKLDYDPNQGGYVVALDKSQLQNAPRHDADGSVYDRNREQEIHDYYGVAPFI